MSFCISQLFSKFSVCEDVCNQINLFDDGQALMASVQDHSELKEMTKNLNTITMLEDRVNEWIKKVMEVRMKWALVFRKIQIFRILFLVFYDLYKLLILNNVHELDIERKWAVTPWSGLKRPSRWTWVLEEERSAILATGLLFTGIGNILHVSFVFHDLSNMYNCNFSPYTLSHTWHLVKR